MNGIIIVNKEKNCTSRDVVNKISKIYNTKKVGHTGTLDPIAEGILIICLNKALKVAEFITSDDKEYIAKLQLGYLTDTLDITGNKLKESNTKVTKEQVIEALNHFKGKIKQQVPIYSAVKVNGKKLYEYARNNIEVELPIKEVTIYNIELLDFNYNKQTLTIKTHVSKGTYIRSLIRDIGLYLNTYATMTSLIRTKQGSIDIKQSSTIEEIEQNKHKLYSIKDILNLPTITIEDNNLLNKIKNGSIINLNTNNDKVLILDKNDNEIAIYIKNNTNYKILKMIDNT